MSPDVSILESETGNAPAVSGGWTPWHHRLPALRRWTPIGQHCNRSPEKACDTLLASGFNLSSTNTFLPSLLMRDIKRQIAAALADIRTVVFTGREFDTQPPPAREHISPRREGDGDGGDSETKDALAEAAPNRSGR